MIVPAKPAAVLALAALALWAAAVVLTIRHMAADAVEPGAGIALDPNAATQGELERLPGIGAATAARIVEERALGPFARPDDLLRVRGVTPELVRRLEQHLSFGVGEDD